MDWSVIAIIVQLIFLEGILSIDNAAVLGAMVTHLPDDRAIVWPKALQKLGDRLHPVLGNQRQAALRVGLLVAYLGRGLMLTVASLVATSVWLKILGAVYLVKLAFDNLGASALDDGEAVVRPIDHTTFWRVVLSVEIADLIFSLDNVVAAVSLSDKLWVVLVGVAIGILCMRFAAGWFSYAVERAPVLKVAAYLLVFNIGVEIFLEEFAGIEISDLLRFVISVSTVAITLVYSYTRPLHGLRPILSWGARGFWRCNAVLEWALEPFFAILRVFWRLLTRIVSLFRTGKEPAGL